MLISVKSWLLPWQLLGVLRRLATRQRPSVWTIEVGEDEVEGVVINEAHGGEHRFMLMSHVVQGSAVGNFSVGLWIRDLHDLSGVVSVIVVVGNDNCWGLLCDFEFHTIRLL